MLTLEQLKAIQPHTLFATGVTIDSPEGINMTNSGKELRWVAVRGEIHDWSIYVHFSSNPVEWVRRFGDKVCREYHITKLVPATKEAMEMYRY